LRTGFSDEEIATLEQLLRRLQYNVSNQAHDPTTSPDT
jgi:hypothetical protein